MVSDSNTIVMYLPITKTETKMKHPNLIDELGALKARKAALNDEERSLVGRIKNEMLAAGEQIAEGELFRAVYLVTSRVSVDTNAVAALFPIELYPSLYNSDVVESLRVNARVGVLHPEKEEA